MGEGKRGNRRKDEPPGGLHSTSCATIPAFLAASPVPDFLA